MLLWNTIGGGVLIGYHLFTGITLFMAFDRMGILRVARNTEIIGLDLIKHKEKAYGFGKGTSPLALPPMNAPRVLNVGSFTNNQVEAVTYPMNVTA